MSTLNEFQEMVNRITDEKLLEVADSLLKDIVEMHNCREKADMLEDGLTKGDRAAFWFFAMGIDKEQVSLAANTVIGRKRFLKEKDDRAKAAHEALNPTPKIEEEKQGDAIDDVIQSLV